MAKRLILLAALAAVSATLAAPASAAMCEMVQTDKRLVYAGDYAVLYVPVVTHVDVVGCLPPI